MRFKLSAKHYADDMMLEEGMIVGDPPSHHLWRFTTDQPRTGFKAGSFMPITLSMIPLDEEAVAAFREKYGDIPPDADPTEAIPLQGNITQVPLMPAKPPVRPPVAAPVRPPEPLKK